MASLQSYIELAQSFHQINAPVDFIIIYIKEAHAADAWKFDGPQYSFIKNHQDIQDRIEAIKIMIEMAKITRDHRIDVYSDTMDDHTNHLFRGWPERLYVLHDDKVMYQGQNGPTGYSIPTLEYFLHQNVSRRV